MAFAISVSAISQSFQKSPNQVELGQTTYDWQTNRGARTWTHVWNDGKISFAYITSSYSGFDDRGTAIVTYDSNTDSWTPSSGKVENEKTGFGTIAQYGTNGLVIASHISNDSVKLSGVYIATNKDNIAPNSLSAVSYLNDDNTVIHPSVMTSGANRDIIHIVAHGYTDGRLYYFRSRDGGQTWDKQNVVLPYTGSDFCPYWIANSYYWMETDNDNCLALVLNNLWSDGFVLYSYDDGENWEKKTYYYHPNPYGTYSADNKLYVPEYTSCRWDSQHRLHVLYSFNGIGGSTSNATLYLGVGGVAYWNEAMPYNINGNTTSAYEGNLIPGQPFVLENEYLMRDIWMSYGGLSNPTHAMWSEFIGYLPSLNSSGEWQNPYMYGFSPWTNDEERAKHGRYRHGVCSFPVLCDIPGTEGLIAVWCAMDKNHKDSSGYYYYHLFASYSLDNGSTWSHPYHLTASSEFNNKELVYPQAAVINNKLVIAVQQDGTAGSYVQYDGSTGQHDSNAFDNFYIGLTYDLEEYFGITSVAENESLQCSLYPNPANDILNVESINPITCCEIYSIEGSLVCRTENCSEKVNINIAELPTGTYLIKIYSDGITQNKMFIKK